MPPRVKIKDLQEDLAKAQSNLTESEATETDLAAANEKIQQQELALAEAIARAEAAAHTQNTGGVDTDNKVLIERPKPSTKGGRIPIQEAMGLDGQDELYGNIQKYIHTLVAACNINWKLAFKLQSLDNLSHQETCIGAESTEGR